MRKSKGRAIVWAPLCKNVEMEVLEPEKKILELKRMPLAIGRLMLTSGRFVVPFYSDTMKNIDQTLHLYPNLKAVHGPSEAISINQITLD
jgi:hypothetical protein